MTDKEVLQKAIEIACKNDGADPDNFHSQTGWMYCKSCDNPHFLTEEMECVCQSLNPNIAGLIFSHVFAKAFWGEDVVDDQYGITKDEFKQFLKDGDRFPVDFKPNELSLRWGCNLQQMVIEENPIDYLRRFINTENQ